VSVERDEGKVEPTASKNQIIVRSEVDAEPETGHDEMRRWEGDDSVLRDHARHAREFGDQGCEKTSAEG
jgi:hypothetical protein